MGRHRHAVNVRADGLGPVLGRLLRDARIRSAALVDVDSGMVLDACTPGQDAPDLEVQAAGHAELVRATVGVLPGPRDSLGRYEVVVAEGSGLHHVLRVIPEDHGGWLALSVVVAGSERIVRRVRRRLRQVSESALTAGPSTARRPSSRWALIAAATAGPAPEPRGPATLPPPAVPDTATPLAAVGSLAGVTPDLPTNATPVNATPSATAPTATPAAPAPTSQASVAGAPATSWFAVAPLDHPWLAPPDLPPLSPAVATAVGRVLRRPRPLELYRHDTPAGSGGADHEPPRAAPTPHPHLPGVSTREPTPRPRPPDPDDRSTVTPRPRTTDPDGRVAPDPAPHPRMPDDAATPMPPPHPLDPSDPVASPASRNGSRPSAPAPPAALPPARRG